MASTLAFGKFLEAFSFAHVNDGFLEDDGESMLVSFMQSEGSSLQKVKALKERGNNLFKQNVFDVAAACYDEACKLLGFVVGVNGDHDVKSLCELAVSLNLNLAACALKLLEHQAAIYLCIIVLSSFPHNVKALFRRALAYMKLKMFREAEDDLDKACLVEPKNKDILRELAVVKNHLAINCNGKRSLGVPGSIKEVSKEEKRQVCSKQSEMEKIVEYGKREDIVENVDCSVRGFCSGLVFGNGCNESKVEDNFNNGSSVQNLITDIEINSSYADSKSPDTNSLDMILDTNIVTQQDGLGENMLNFFKKRGGDLHLRIPALIYQKLLNGNEVSFYQKFQLSTLKVRILKPVIDEPSENLSTTFKKKKKRRRKKSKKGKYKATTVNDDVISSPTLSNYEGCNCEMGINNNGSSAPAINATHLTEFAQASSAEQGSDQSCELKISDEFSPKKTEIMMCEGDVGLVGTKSVRRFKRRPSSFARLFKYRSLTTSPNANYLKKLACSAMTRLRVQRFRSLWYPFIHHVQEKWRNATSKKNHSQGDESPRHNLSTFSKSRSLSHKFLRPRGVSVSCCRYFSEAQVIKKRKEMFAQLASSDRPVKKPILVVNPSVV